MKANEVRLAEMNEIAVQLRTLGMDKYFQIILKHSLYRMIFYFHRLLENIS